MPAPRLGQVLSNPQHKVREEHITTHCDQCGEDRNIAECVTAVKENVRSYRCPVCSDLLVIIDQPGDKPIPGRGSRIGDWVVRNVTPLDVFVAHGAPHLSIPASTQAIRPDDTIP